MKKHDRSSGEVVGDWSAATWEGARLEQMRRWAALPLERAILALEEMEQLARELRDAPVFGRPRGDSGVASPPEADSGRRSDGTRQ